MSTLTEALSKHAGVVLAEGILWCTCGAELWSQRTGFTAGVLPMHGTVGETAHIHHLAAVVAEWLGSDEARAAVAEAIDRNVEAEDYLPIYSKDGSRCVDSGAAKAALAALAAHAKGETDD